jgi:hypothetical protein
MIRIALLDTKTDEIVRAVVRDRTRRVFDETDARQSRGLIVKVDDSSRAANLLMVESRHLADSISDRSSSKLVA